MGIKKYNPYTPSRRHMTGSDFSEITKTTPEKSLISATMNKQAGRNNQGKITVRHRGGGAKRKYRIIDFKRNSKDGIPATVIGIEYDPNRTANIALICYADGTKSYICLLYTSEQRSERQTFFYIVTERCIIHNLRKNCNRIER